MNFTWRGLLTFLLLALTFEVLAQGEPVEKIAPENLRKRVSTIESFIRRFNYDEDGLGNRIAVPKGEALSKSVIGERGLQILDLFDQKLLANTHSRSLTDDFLKDVNSETRQVRISLLDQQWFAEVQMDVLYKQKPAKATLILKLEEEQHKEFRWAICGVKAGFLDIEPKQKDKTKLIPPNSHGTDFIGIPQNLSDPKSIGHFTSRDALTDELSIFLYAVYNNEITFKQAKHVAYYFFQIDNWILRVEDINHNLINSGFMVAELIKANNTQKRAYALKQLNIAKNL